jgi:hypothetical protein
MKEFLEATQEKHSQNNRSAQLQRKLRLLEPFSDKDRKAVLHYTEVIAEKNRTKRLARIENLTRKRNR